MFRATRCSAVVLLLAPWGATGQASSVRDSAGIAIVTSARPAWGAGEALRLGSVPELVIGASGGPPYELHRVAGAARLGSGHLVVADGGSLELRVYDAKGAFLKAAGGRGRGPGEFQRMESLVHLRGDTLAVFESPPRKVEYFDANGTPLWSVTSYRPSPGQTVPRLRLMLGAFADGSAVVVSLTNPAPRKFGARWIHTVPVVFVNRSSEATRDLGELPFGVVAMDGQPTQPWFSPPLSVANNDDVFFIGLGTEYSIRAYHRDGRIARIIRRAWTPTKVSTSDIESFVTEWGKRWIKATGAEADRQRADLRDDPYAATVPAFSQFIADRVGRLWVRTPNLSDAPLAGQMNTTPIVPSVWSVFDREGRWLGDVTFPPRFRPYEIGERYVLGVAFDKDGVETVVQFALHGG